MTTHLLPALFSARYELTDCSLHSCKWQLPEGGIDTWEDRTEDFLSPCLSGVDLPLSPSFFGVCVCVGVGRPPRRPQCGNAGVSSVLPGCWEFKLPPPNLCVLFFLFF